MPSVHCPDDYHAFGHLGASLLTSDKSTAMPVVKDTTDHVYTDGTHCVQASISASSIELALPTVLCPPSTCETANCHRPDHLTKLSHRLHSTAGGTDEMLKAFPQRLSVRRHGFQNYVNKVLKKEQAIGDPQFTMDDFLCEPRQQLTEEQTHGLSQVF